MDYKTFKRYFILKNLVQYHDRLYYDQDEPQLSDKDYDLLYAKYEEMEKQHPEFILDDAPSQRVGGKVSKSFHKLKHRKPMYSLAKVHTIEEFSEWDVRMRKLLKS